MPLDSFTVSQSDPSENILAGVSSQFNVDAQKFGGGTMSSWTHFDQASLSFDEAWASYVVTGLEPSIQFTPTEPLNPPTTVRNDFILRNDDDSADWAALPSPSWTGSSPLNNTTLSLIPTSFFKYDDIAELDFVEITLINYQGSGQDITVPVTFTPLDTYPKSVELTYENNGAIFALDATSTITGKGHFYTSDDTKWTLSTRPRFELKGLNDENNYVKNYFPDLSSSSTAFVLTSPSWKFGAIGAELDSLPSITEVTEYVRGDDDSVITLSPHELVYTLDWIGSFSAPRPTITFDTVNLEASFTHDLPGDDDLSAVTLGSPNFDSMQAYWGRFQAEDNYYADNLNEDGSEYQGLVGPVQLQRFNNESTWEKETEIVPTADKFNFIVGTCTSIDSGGNDGLFTHDADEFIGGKGEISFVVKTNNDNRRLCDWSLSTPINLITDKNVYFGSRASENAILFELEN